jgi:molybdenum cofactor cytidylyltransferase
VAALLGVRLRTLLTPELLGALLGQAQGGLKSAPARARIVPFVNKVEGEERLGMARQIAAAALASPAVERVVLGAAQAAEPVAEVVNRTSPRPYVSAVVLAAGGSRRLGRLKQLLPWGGQTMIEHVVDTVLASTVDEVVVVLGCQAEAVQQALAGRPVRGVVNATWDEGLATSLHAGLAAVSPQAEAALFVLGDQPRLTAQTINRLLAHYRATRRSVVVPVYMGQRGNPVLFARPLFPELLALQGDVGGRVLLEKQGADVAEVDVGSDEILLDVDTLEDYEAQVR